MREGGVLIKLPAPVVFQANHQPAGEFVRCEIKCCSPGEQPQLCGFLLMPNRAFDRFVAMTAGAINFSPTIDRAVIDPAFAIGRAIAMIPEDCFLVHLQQVPAGWNAKIGDKIDDRLEWEATEEVTPAAAIMRALGKRATGESLRSLRTESL